MQYKTQQMVIRKDIALLAHDNKKEELCHWASKHLIEKLMSGPLGDDQQVGAMIATCKLDVLIFFWDPLEAQPRDPDVKASLRITVVWNIPVACNQSSADFIFSSGLITRPYERKIPDYGQYLQNRDFTTVEPSS